MTTFLPRCQVYSLDHWREFILGFDASYSSSFFPPTLPLWAPYFLIFSTLHPTPRHALSPSPSTAITRKQQPSPFFLPPSPFPLSQLPEKLAAIQDTADGSVIRSASLRSLFSSPHFFLSFFSV